MSTEKVQVVFPDKPQKRVKGKSTPPKSDWGRPGAIPSSTIGEDKRVSAAPGCGMVTGAN